MTKSDAADLARACRQQALLASTEEARKTLRELAERYESEAASVDPLDERNGERLE